MPLIEEIFDDVPDTEVNKVTEAEGVVLNLGLRCSQLDETAETISSAEFCSDHNALICDDVIQEIDNTHRTSKLIEDISGRL